VTLPAPAAPAVTTLTCRSCGAPLTVRAPGVSVTVACGSCGAVLDAQDPEAAVLAKYAAQTKVTPLLPLGRRGTLRGEMYEVIGYMVRETRIEGIVYTWGEYLLYNRALGLRWLTEYAGHWTLTKTASATPRKFQVAAEYLGATFKHFQTVSAKVRYVVGEFPWRVAVGDAAVVTDYIDPPRVLSSEVTDRETVWSIGDYVEGARVWKAFALEGPAPAAHGVGAGQPSPFTGHGSNVLWLFLALVAVAFAVQILFGLFSQRRIVFERGFTYDPHGPEPMIVTEPFTLTGRRSNVVVETDTSLLNNWAYFNFALVNQDTGTALTFGREVSFYRGRDSDGEWTEGSAADAAWLPSVPSGTYYLLIEPDPRAQPMRYVVRVRRDVPRLVYLWVALGLLMVPPVVFWYRAHAFEYRRWQESDHPMGRGGSSGEGDGDDDD
jgi:uncharacterized protein DUF4178